MCVMDVLDQIIKQNLFEKKKFTCLENSSRNHKLGSRFLFELCVSFFSFPPICFKYTIDNPIGFPWNNLESHNK